MTCECGAVTAYRACEACYEAELYGDWPGNEKGSR